MDAKVLLVNPQVYNRMDSMCSQEAEPDIQNKTDTNTPQQVQQLLPNYCQVAEVDMYKLLKWQ